MYRRWEDDWMHSNFVPEYVALSRLFENDDLKVLVRLHGTTQRHFYTLTRFEQGVSVEVPGDFPTLEEAKAAGCGLLDADSDTAYEAQRFRISPELDEFDIRNGL